MDLLANQANTFGVANVCIGDASRVSELRGRLNRPAEVFSGVEGMCGLATLAEAICGPCGGGRHWDYAYACGARGWQGYRARVQGGAGCSRRAHDAAGAKGRRGNPAYRQRAFRAVSVSPGSAGEERRQAVFDGVRRPFRTTPREALKDVTVEQALKHPTWNMGGLVTINSATLMNKGLEIIEARWLFGVPADDVEIVVHPQSIVHSMVRYKDGSVLAQLGLPDMRLPIQYALVYPERIDTQLPRMGIDRFANLTFEEPDLEKFPAIRLARRAAATGGTMPAVMNAANEAAVARFLDREIRIPWYNGVRRAGDGPS